MSEELKPKTVNISADEVLGIGWHPDPELKDCPYCPAGKGKIIIRGEKDWVTCDNNHCRSNAVMPMDDWNNRPLEDALRKQVVEEREKKYNFVEKLDIAKKQLEVAMKAFDEVEKLTYSKGAIMKIVNRAKAKIEMIGKE